VTRQRIWFVIGGVVVVLALIFLGLYAFGVFDDNGKAAATVPLPTASSTYATPAPTAAPTGTTATTVCPGDHEVKAGETYDVPAGCNLKGDVVVNGVQQYDDDPATGLIVSCPHGCTIMAPWGANVTPRAVDDLKTEMLSSGCGSECSDVKVVVIDDKGTNVQVADLCDVSLPKGTTATVPGGCVISGDVEVNGEPLYDSAQDTGLVVIVESDVEVFAPYGASVTNADSQDVVDAVEQTGCGLPNGCRVVNTATVP